MQSNSYVRTAIGAVCLSSVFYAICVVAYVTATPDLRLRCLADGSAHLHSRGLIIRATASATAWGDQRPPASGDVLVRLNGRPTPTFLDFTQAVEELRWAKVRNGGWVYPGDDPRASDRSWPSLIEERDDDARSRGGSRTNGTRWVRAEIVDGQSGSERSIWLKVQSVPAAELVPTFVWLLCQLGILLVAAVSAWNRPFDGAARLFLLMGSLAMFAFVGGFHWWVIAATPWLNVPFILGGMMLPAVSLHFFLSFPRPRQFLQTRATTARVAIYALPAFLTVVTVVCLISIHAVHGEGGESALASAIAWLDRLRIGLRVFLVVAGVYFVLTVAALWQGYVAYRGPVERGQLRWILGAALLATAPILYTVYLASFQRVEFATGRGRIPMLIASLAFMLAYAVAIVRYKLISAYEFLTRSTLYYVVSGLLTVGLAFGLTGSVVAATGLPTTLTPLQGRVLVGILVLAAVLLIWLRDRVQGLADRHFFSEKYRLDEAFQRMNPAAAPEVDPEALGERLLQTCRDVLRVERSCLYLRPAASRQFALVVADGAEDLPRTLELAPDSLDAVRGTTLLRVRGDSGSGNDPVQELLRTSAMDLMQVLSVDGGGTGLLLLGNRGSSAFTAEDATFLQALAQIASVGFYGSRVHHELSRRDDELRVKMEQAARQQRQIALLQAELKSLDSPRAVTPTRSEQFRREAIKGDGPAITAVLETVQKVADSDATVLVRGESGTGKELLAKVLHENGPRREKNLVRVNCAALSPTLLESELFGHVRGAFTGADRDRVGRFEMANGGTLFLDEIGDVSLDTQVKLLRVVQERCFERVGGTETVHVDVRLVTATHQDLEELIRQRRFREDLYYRLNVVTVTLPPLRSRVEDLPELVFHFLHDTARRTGKRVRDLDEGVWDVLEAYDWPGNVRQLRNVVERAVVLAEGDTVTVSDLPAELTEFRPTAERPVVAAAPVRVPPVRVGDRRTAEADGFHADDGDERTRLLEALRKSDGNKARAARMLGMPRSTYYSKLKKYEIPD